MKSFFSLIAILFLSVQLFAQEVPEIQRPLLSKVAATWCPPCGGWGWDMFENLLDDNANKATLLVAHHSGDLVNPVSEDFSDNFNAPYQPYFYFNTEDQGVNSGNTADKRIEIQNKVNAAYQESPVANTGMELVFAGDIWTDNSLTVTAKTKFFQEADGEFYLGIYFVENDIVNNQQGQGANAVHDRVLRGAITDGSFGELLVNGNVAAGTEFDETYTSILNADWDYNHMEENVQIVSIIWEKVGSTYEVINTNIVTDYVALVSTKDVVLKEANMDVVPTVVKAYSTLFINSSKALNNAQIDLVDLNGKKVATIFDGTIVEGESIITLEKTSAISKGLYYVVLQADDKVLSKPIIID